MKYALKVLFFTTIFLTGTYAIAKTSTDLSNLDDATRSLVTKEKMRTVGLNSGASQTDGGKDSMDPLKRKNTTLIDGGVSSGCDINIGNSKPKPGMNSKPTTVIITGPVIQMPGKGCK
jgi:hypothetical protein